MRKPSGRLRAMLREDQIILDLVNIPQREKFADR